MTTDPHGIARWIRDGQRADFDEARRTLAPLEAHLPELALAFAAARGDEDAVAEVERLVRAARPHVARISGDAQFLDDVQQLTLSRLLLGPQARLHDYAGRGPLGAWVRAVAVRIAIDERRRTRELPDDDVGVFLHAARPPGDATRALTSARVTEAIRAALAGLPARERTLLRLHHLEGATLDALATMYSVHRASVARWLADARALVLQQTRVQLSTVAGDDELSAALESVQSMLDVSFRQLFDGT